MGWLGGVAQKGGCPAIRNEKLKRCRTKTITYCCDVTISNAGVTAIGSGVIVDADISATAEIAVSKLADGAARQLLQTDAAGTGVEWTDSIDLPGTLDVTGAATFDSTVYIAGALTLEGTTADAHELTLSCEPTADRTITFPDATGTLVLSGAITNTDISASAAIADTKLATISTAGKVSNSATTAVSTNTASAIVARDASGNFSAGTITAALSGNATTATTLATARNIQGVSFDGSANITVVTAGSGISVTGTAVANTGVLSVNGNTGAITNVAVTNTAQSFSAQQRGAISALTDGATITPDFSAANNFSVTLGGNRTLANPTNLTAGASGCIWITQDGTGSRTLAYGSYWDFTGGTAPTLTTTASGRDCLVYSVQSSTQITATLITNLS
jgi:hypothetical protein